MLKPNTISFKIDEDTIIKWFIDSGSVPEGYEVDSVNDGADFLWIDCKEKK